MPQYAFGRMIKEYRKRKNITQEELALGLCDISTLSKIEAGKRDPYRKLAIALMNRLGIDTTLFNIPLTEEEYQRSVIERKIIAKYKTNDYSYADALEEYVNCGKEMNILEQQFYLTMKAYFADTAKQRLSELKEALYLTYKNDILKDKLSGHYLTDEELALIGDIATCYIDLDEFESAILIQTNIVDYIKGTLDKSKYIVNTMLVSLQNKSLCYGLLENYEKCYESTIEGQKLSIQYKNLNHMHMFLYLEGVSLIKLDKIEQGKRVLVKSFLMLESYKMAHTYGELAEDIQDMFGKEFWLDIKHRIKNI